MTGALPPTEALELRFSELVAERSAGRRRRGGNPFGDCGVENAGMSSFKDVRTVFAVNPRVP
jgi:hypothetical protein